MSVREILVSYGEPLAGPDTTEPVHITNARTVRSVVGPLLEREACEVGYVLCLTTKMELIGFHEISRGSLDATTIHPREVFKAAVLVNAGGVILVHNHPSGDPSPSPEDVALTKRIREAGRLMGIELVDHVIIGHGDRFISLKEHCGSDV